MRSSWRPRAGALSPRPRNPLCVALDGDPQTCRKLAAQTSAAATHKIGLTAFVSGGPELVRELTGATSVFLDLKLHDIPAQVASAIASATQLGARYATVHAGGGSAMLRAAAAAAEENLTLLAVTVLTSLDDDDLARTGVTGDVPAQVLRLAELALGEGIRGLVCSPLEVAALRERFGTAEAGGPLLVVPGIRPSSAGGSSDDQKRTRGPREALADGADLLVVGRPITGAPDPEAATSALLAEIDA